MRKQLIGAASVAILASVVLAGCNFGTDEKEEAAPGAGGSEAGAGSGEAASGGKPATGGAATGTDGGAEGSGDASSPKPEDGAAGGGQGGASGGTPTTGSGGGSGGVQRVGEVPNEFANLMVQYLDHYAGQYGQGLSRAGQPDVVTALRAGEEHRWTVNLEQGQTYGFFGACDNDCTDVDIIVEDANGREVASDVLTDDYPVVAVQNATAGRYTARILMVSCSVEPCFVGARLLRQ